MTQGINVVEKFEKEVLYSELYDEYVSSNITLQQLGEKYGLTRQESHRL